MDVMALIFEAGSLITMDVPVTKEHNVQLFCWRGSLLQSLTCPCPLRSSATRLSVPSTLRALGPAQPLISLLKFPVYFPVFLINL